MKLKIALAALALATVAQAVPINGQINITSAPGTTVTVNPTLNTVAFTPNGVGPGPTVVNNAQVDTSTSNLASLLPSGTALSYRNFTYSPINVNNPIWQGTAGGFVTSFALTSITFVQEGFNLSGAFVGVLLEGSGIMSSTRPGFDPTPGAWSFSANATGSSFSWGSTGRVPDGGATLALLGASVLGLGGTRRFLASSKK